jgi:molybdate transport system substrate-binding protein
MRWSSPHSARSRRALPGSHVLLAASLLVIVNAAGCGGDGGRPSLTVSAAASLKRAFDDYGSRFTPARARFSFGGSDELAGQIRQGVRPDVYAAANTELPQALYRDGLVERPVVFARNRLVIALPASGSRIRSIAGLAAPNVKLVVGAQSVPVGSYTRQVLDRLPAGERAGILRNVRSNEPDVSGIVAKLAQGAADAGFVYVTDVTGAGGKLRALELPARLRPNVSSGASVVRGSHHAAEARSFIAGLLQGAGRDALRRAGFAPAPAQ